MERSLAKWRWCTHKEWNLEVGWSSSWNQTNWLQVSIQEKIQIIWLTWQTKIKACGEMIWTKIRNWLWRNILPHNKIGYHPHFALHGNTKWVEIPPNRCKNFILKWRLERKCLHVSTKRICCKGTITQSMKTCKILVWPKTSTISMVWKDNRASSKAKFQAL